MTIQLHCTITGPVDAPMVVLLSSLGGSGQMWDPQVGTLSEHFRLVRIDARGHGRSPAAVAQPCTIADLAADVLAVLDRLDAPRVHLAGLSLGGMTAMWLAAHHPERVARLALLCTSAKLPSKNWLDRAAAVRRDGLASIADSVVARWLTPGLGKRDPQLRAGLLSMMTSTDPESYAQCCEAIAAMDLLEDLSRIAASTLIIAGAQDLATPLENLEAIAAGIAGSRLQVVADAAHIATVQQAGIITQLLLRHFGGGVNADRADGGDAGLAAGYAMRRAVLGAEHVDRSIAGTSALTAPFQDFITRYAWAEVWSRPGLSRRERSIATLAALVTLGAEHEIGMHVRAALRNGLSQDEIGEVLLHTALYAGLPRANRAFAIAQQSLHEIDHEESNG